MPSALPCFALLLCALITGTGNAQCIFTLQGVPASLCGDASMTLALDTTGGNFGDDNDVVITWTSTVPGTFSCTGCLEPVFTPNVPVLTTVTAATITASVTSPSCPGPNSQSATFTLLATPLAGLNAAIAGTSMATSAAYGPDMVTFILCQDPPPASTSVDFTDASTGTPGYTTLITPNGTAVPASGVFAPGLSGGTYTVTDPASGCSSVQAYQVLVGPPVLSISAQLGIAGTTFACADDPIAFEITPTGQSPLGMIYTIHESYDLAPSNNPVAVITNVPAGTTTTFFHAFNINSCGGTHAGGPNTAGLEVTPAYGCYFGPPVTPITTNGVYISNEPVAAINGPIRACIGPVTFDNISQGAWIDNLGVCHTGPEDGYWNISGNTPSEWTVTAGQTLGDDGGTPNDPLNWNYGSDPLTIDFLVAGTYTVGFTVASRSGCGASSYYEYDICIEAPQAPSTFIVAPLSGCAPFTPNITNQGPVDFGCDGTYEWSVQFGGSDCTTSGDYTCVDCTDQFDPSITFNGPGTYAITMMAASGCPGTPVVHEVEIFAPPTVTMDALPVQVCTSQCLTPTATVAGCGDDTGLAYAWTFTNASITTFNGPTPPQICPVAAGVELGIQLTVSNTCGPPTTAQVAVPVVNVNTPLSVLSDGPVCEGGTITLSASGGGAGATYIWSDPSGTVSALSSTATLVIGNASNVAHNGSWSVSAGSGPCDAAGSIDAVVYAAPVVNVAAGPQSPLCFGGTTTLTASAGQTAGNYQWSGGPGTAAWADVAPFPPSTNYAVIFTDGATGCTGQGNITIVVGNGSTVQAAPPIAPACDQAAAVALDGGSPTGGTWAIIGAGPGAISGPIDAQTYAPEQGAGPYTVTLQYAIASGGCPGTALVAVDVPASTPADAGPPTLACDCQGAIVLSGVSPAAGQWTPIAGILDAQGNFNTCTSGPGTFTVQYCPSLAGTCTACASTTVVVHALPEVGPFVDLAACDDTGLIELPQPDATGTWSGSFVSASAPFTFDTDAAPLDEVGTVLTYSYPSTDPGIVCTNTAPMTVRVYPTPTAAFNVAAGPFCAGTSVSFADTSVPGAGATIDLWSWDFGDPGSVDNTAYTGNATHAYATGGNTYPVTLTIQQGSCSASATQEVDVLEQPVAEFSVETASGCAPVLALFQQSMADITVWNWDFDYPNGDTSMEQDPVHVYEDPGAYQVMLAVGNGCASDTLFLPVTAGAPPQLAPISSPGLACNGTPVAFELANGPWANVQWIFGDPASGVANFANGGAAVHLFSASGAFAVSVVAEDPITHCQGAAELPITVSDTLNATFTLSSSAGCAPLLVDLQSTTAAAADMQWTIYDADGAVTAFGAAASYTFTNSGTFSIRLLAEHGSGCMDSSFTAVEVYPAVVASFSTAPLLLCGVPADVVFSNTSSGVGPLAYTWSFGVIDDQSIAVDPTYTYTAPGDYEVCLAVESEDACTASHCEQVLVNPAPNVDFDAAALACVGTSVQFAALGDQGQYRWWFGDGATSLLASPAHSYDAPGVYDVALSVNGEGGCRDSIYLAERVVVMSTPVAAFSVDTLVNSAQLPIYDFHDASSGAITLQWDFGDGSTSDQPDPRHEFPGSYGANYTTCLTVANEAGCSDMECTTFFYNAGGNIFIPNSFTPNGDQKNDVFFPVINGFDQCRSFDLWIYDRWGNLVDHLQDRNDSWDGTFHGAEPLIDVYVWRLSLSDCLDGTDPDDRRGHVTIVLDKSE